MSIGIWSSRWRSGYTHRDLDYEKEGEEEMEEKVEEKQNSFNKIS